MNNQVGADNFMASSQEGDGGGVLRGYLRLALRYIWVIAGAAAAGLLIMLVVTLMTDKRYSSSVDLEISREDANIVNIQGVQPEGGSLDLEFYQTQYGLLEARSLAERVIEDLDLVDDEQFLAKHDLTEVEIFGGDLALPNDRASRDARRKKIVEHLFDHIDIVPERASRLVTVTYTDTDPVMAARIANAWAEAFIETNLERRFDASAYAREFLEERLGQVRDQLNASERKLVDYAANQRIITLEEGDGEDGTRGRRSILAENLQTANSSLAEARSDKITAQAIFERARATAGSATENSLSNVGISTLRSSRAEVQAEVARLEAQFGPAYPALVALKAQLAELNAAIAREEGRVLRTLRTNFEAANAREQALQNKVDQATSDMIDLRRRSIQYNIFQRDVDTNRELYDGLLQRYKEIGIAAGVGTNNVAIVDSAQPPEEPSGPRLLVNLLLGLLGGTAIGAALAYTFDQLDEAISDPADVQRITKLPLLGTVPDTEMEDTLEEIIDPKSEMTEAYLSITTSLRFATSKGVPRALAVTSSRPSEGKSTTSLAVALTLARQGRKVLLVDADMRNPSVHKLFNMRNESGTSNMLVGENISQQGIIDGPNENLKVMFAGPQPPNAAELLSGDGLQRMLEGLLAEFEHVIIDSPPVLGLADAPLIAEKVGEILFVTEAHETPVRIIEAALERLNKSGANILGLVLNKLKRSRVQYGYEYGYTYGSSDTKADEGL